MVSLFSSFFSIKGERPPFIGKRDIFPLSTSNVGLSPTKKGIPSHKIWGLYNGALFENSLSLIFGKQF